MTDVSQKTLTLSADKAFYTLEGEGEYIGFPAVFLRLSYCNLSCIGFKSKDSPNGCDSYVSWSVKNKMTFEEVAQYFEENDLHTKLLRGAILKITGGEPLIQQKALLEFVEFIIDRWGFYKQADCTGATLLEIKKPMLRIDFETNATLMPDDKWVTKYNASFTTSPKLSNNGDPEDKRYKPEVLRYLVEQNACFKFVARKESDLDEVFTKYINNPDINLSRDQIWIMPMCGSREELIEVGPAVADICKKHQFKFSNRMHLQIWDKALLV